MVEACEYDVVVVGCGPVGAFAGNLIGRTGRRCLVIEEAADIHALPRAVHIDHEMMRLLQSIGLSSDMAPRMREAHGHVHIGADGGVIRYLGTAGSPRRYGWANDYFFFQPELDADLRTGLSRFDTVTLELGTALTALVQDPDGVTLTVRDGEGSRRVRAHYVIACDGARSTARKALGVALDDLRFEEPWLVVDARVDGPVRFPDCFGLPAGADLQKLSVMMCDPRRPATVVPGRGDHRRWEFMLLPGERDDEMMAPETVDRLLAPWVQGSNHDVIRAATYRFHGLVADRWRVGRVFLAGDAAHQTPPFFGQGMCHGFRDVSNLAWKLDLVLRGVAGPDLVETYQTERDPHVRAVIGRAIEAGRYICELDPKLAALRDARLREETGGVRSELIPAYEGGVVGPGGGERFIQPWVIAPDGGRVLLDDATGGGFVLLTRNDAARFRAVGGHPVEATLGLRRHEVVTGATPSASPHLIDADGDLAAWLDARGADAVLLRPDAYVYGVAPAGSDAEALLDALAADLRLIAPASLEQEFRLCTA